MGADGVGVGKLRLFAAAVVVCLAAAAPAAAADPYASLLAPPRACGGGADELNLDAATAATAMLCLTNYARTHSGLAPLKANALLDRAGAAKLAADVSCREFSHTPCGRPFQSVFADYLTGAASYSIGENIAWGTGGYGTPRATMDAWLNSTGHRENILNASFTELGIGYVPATTFLGYDGAALWSQEFGTRTAAKPAAPRPHRPARRYRVSRR